MPRRPTQDALWDIIRSRHRGVLATIAADGMPHLTNVHYLADPDVRLVRLTTETGRAKGKNLLRDPRAVLHVQGDDWFSFAVAEGQVTVGIAEQVGDAACDELYELITTLRGPAPRPEFDEEMTTNDRMVMRLEVDRLYGLVNPRPESSQAGAA